VTAASRRPGGSQFIPRPTSWTLGDLLPPRAHPLAISVADVAASLADAPTDRPLEPSFEGARPSAVLIALADGAIGAEVLLTRRSMHLSSHRGDVSFPGGRIDPDEAPVDAARREAHEEVGLDPGAVEVIGELPHFNTVVSRSYIIPVVARVASPVPLVPTSPEVARVFWLPLAELVRPDTYRTENWGMPAGDRLLHFFELDDETVWGVTAAILVELLSLG
jgi:8-oxo-dGTP pyrophosphatase MutT (NUDIX family)